jgi:signal transduction histidine kinase
MFSSLRARLVLSHLIVIVLAMGLSGFLLLTFVEDYFLQATEDSLLAQARITAQALIPGVISEGPASASPAYNAIQQQQASNLNLQTENLDLPDEEFALGDVDLTYLTDVSLQIGTQLETRIRLLDSDGIILVDSWQTDVGTDLSAEPLVGQASEGHYAVRGDSGGDDRMMHLIAPVHVDGQLVGFVYLSQPLRDMTVVLQDLRTRWLLSTVIALIVSSGMALLLARVITNPIHRLTEAASAVARGQFDHKVPVRSRDALGHLSRTFNDMTVRLQAARQMQVDFVADVSHELRTPLTSVKAAVETLRAGAVDDPEVRDRFLATVEGETERLIRLVNDLLLLSRVDSEALNLRRESVDVKTLVDAAVEHLQAQADTRDQVVRVQVQTNTPATWVDPDRVQQVLVNLLDNALKYSPPGSEVTITAGSSNNQAVLVEIRDQGIGIPAADLPHIGQRFYRADKARSRAQGGSGLGVAIARSLVQAHGGKLWLDSEDGKGVVARFTLPASA